MKTSSQTSIVVKFIVPLCACIFASCGVTGSSSSTLSGGNRRGGGETAGSINTPVSSIAVMARAFEVQTLLWRTANVEGLDSAKSAQVAINAGQVSIVTDIEGLKGICQFSRKSSHGGQSFEELYNCGAQIVGSGEVESTISGVYALVGSLKVLATFPENLPSPSQLQVVSVDVSFAEDGLLTIVKSKFSNGSERAYHCSNPTNYYSSRSCSEISSH